MGRHGVNHEHRYDVDIAIDWQAKNLTVLVLKDLFNNVTMMHRDLRLRQLGSVLS